MNCPHCKAFVSDGSLVCAKCGKSLLHAESSKQNDSKEKSHHSTHHHRHHHSSESGRSHHSREHSESRSSESSRSSYKRSHSHYHKSSRRHHSASSNSNLHKMTLAALVLFFPLGIFAFLKARKMNELIRRGDKEQAYALIDSVEKLSVLSILIGILFYIFMLMVLLHN